ncbi:hypothetical protein [Paraburkholderia youngii]|uniref:hypothetical protein n=1 Tax=Paraburkholderia youngii TaxID=2782701 RepID=UPI003D1A455E
MNPVISAEALAVATSAAARVVERVPVAVKYWLGEAVSIMLTIRDGRAVRLEAIWSEDARRAGKGSHALSILSRIADEEQVRVELAVHQLLYDTEQPGMQSAEADRLDRLNGLALDNAALKAWYERHGYVASGHLDGDSVVMARDADPKYAGEGISRGIAEFLLADLKTLCGEIDAFRYQSIASRIVAAEYGRADAVEWAMEWYERAIRERLEAKAQKIHDAQVHAKVADRSRERFISGYATNPRYQLFLDTVEEPATVTNNVAYMAWISVNSAAFDKQHPKGRGEDSNERAEKFTAFLKSVRDSNLSERVRRRDGIAVEA